VSPAGKGIQAQDNYEIQIYGSETVQPGMSMVELHSNFTFDGSEETIKGVAPTKSSVHETLEITRGLTSFFEIGGYLFTTLRPGSGWNWVGSHLRPRVRVPEEWQWPFGASLSAEFGYQRRTYSTDTWTLELRPIIDHQSGDWYLSVNPTLELAIEGLDRDAGLQFSPGLKIGYAFTAVVNAGLEYYSSLGRIAAFDPITDQQHQLFPSVDLNLSPEWEFNFGVGIGLTPATDHLIAKLILGRRFGS
jgi:hypothetical protein